MAKVKVAKPVSFSQIGGKIPPPATPAENATMRKNIAVQQGAAARAVARAPKPIPAPKKSNLMDNITGVKTRAKLGKNAMGGM